jgi:hypothetical protein
MDPAYFVMLIGLGIAVFFTGLRIFMWKVLEPRALKEENDRRTAMQAAVREAEGR